MRLIDTDKLLEKTECLFKDLNSTEDYMGIGYNHGVGDSIAIVKNAPTIEAEPVKHGRWIPCRERLPEGANRTYWVCTDEGDQMECRWTNANLIFSNLTTDWHWNIFDIPQYQKVIAWMPLPDPYTEEGEEA